MADDKPSFRLWLVLGLTMLLPLLGAVCYFWLFVDSMAASALYMGTKIFTVVWPPIAWRWILGMPWPCFKPGRHTIRHIGWGLLVGSAMVAFVFAVSATPLWAVAEQAEPDISERASQLGFLDHYILFALFLSIIHAAIEEVYWRGFLYSQMARVFPAGRAVLLASIAFTSHHIVVLWQYFPLMWVLILSLAVFTAGCVWCIMFGRQRSLVGAWVSHMMVDFAVMAMGYRILFGW